MFSPGPFDRQYITHPLKHVDHIYIYIYIYIFFFLHSFRLLDLSISCKLQISVLEALNGKF